MDIVLETERLILRRLVDADVDNLVELDGDPEVMRYISGGRPTPRHQIETDTLPALLRYYSLDSGFGYWAAVETSTGRFIGWFHLRPGQHDSPDSPELGYRLRRVVWGRGYATEGSRALIRRAFAELGARRVSAKTMAINLGSRRVMEKSGLRFVRTFHADWPEPIPGCEHGDVEYALTLDQWSAGETIA